MDNDDDNYRADDDYYISDYLQISYFIFFPIVCCDILLQQLLDFSVFSLISQIFNSRLHQNGSAITPNWRSLVSIEISV